MENLTKKHFKIGFMVLILVWFFIAINTIGKNISVDTLKQRLILIDNFLNGTRVNKDNYLYNHLKIQIPTKKEEVKQYKDIYWSKISRKATDGWTDKGFMTNIFTYIDNDRAAKLENRSNYYYVEDIPNKLLNGYKAKVMKLAIPKDVKNEYLEYLNSLQGFINNLNISKHIPFTNTSYPLKIVRLDTKALIKVKNGDVSFILYKDWPKDGKFWKYTGLIYNCELYAKNRFLECKPEVKKFLKWKEISEEVNNKYLKVNLYYFK